MNILIVMLIITVFLIPFLIWWGFLFYFVFYSWRKCLYSQRARDYFGICTISENNIETLEVKAGTFVLLLLFCFH